MPPSATRWQGIPAAQGAAPQPAPNPGTARTIQRRTAGIPAGTSRAPRSTTPTTLLHDTAKAIEQRWRETPIQEASDQDAFFLEAALNDLRTFCAWLSACYRLRAISNPTPQTFAAASLVHAAERFLHQAGMILPSTGTYPAEQEPWEDPAAEVAPHGGQAAAPQWQPTATVDENVLELLAEALGTLASRTGALPRKAPDPLPALRACLNAAATQLRAARQASWPQ